MAGHSSSLCTTEKLKAPVSFWTFSVTVKKSYFLFQMRDCFVSLWNKNVFKKTSRASFVTSMTLVQICQILTYKMTEMKIFPFTLTASVYSAAKNYCRQIRNFSRHSSSLIPQRRAFRSKNMYIFWRQSKIYGLKSIGICIGFNADPCPDTAFYPQFGSGPRKPKQCGSRSGSCQK